MLRISQMDHIVLNASDIDRSLRFYHEVLGLPVERLEEYREGVVGFPSVRINEHTIIDLFPPERHQRVMGEGFVENLNHLCLVTEHDDIQQVIDHLKTQGIELEQGPVPRWGAHGIGTSVYFRDPDSNLVEVRTYQSEASPPAQA